MGRTFRLPLACFLDSDYIVITISDELTMKTKLVRIGNSRGVRLPKPLIEQAGLTDEVELEVRDGTIVIAALLPVRSGWTTAAKELRARQGDTLLDEPASTRFDEQEWEW